MKRVLRWLALAAVTGLVGAVIALYPHRHYLVAVDWPDYDYGLPDRTRIEPLTLFNHERVMGEILGEPLIDVQRVAILVYDGADTFEAVGAMALFSQLMSVRIDYVAPAAGVVRTQHADLLVEQTYADISAADLLVVPGGTAAAIAALRADPRTLDWIGRIDAGSRLTLATGTGVDLLADTGHLVGRRVVAPAASDGASAISTDIRRVDARYVQDDKYWTADRGSAVLDVGLAMVGAIAGQAHLQGAMLDLEYDPAIPSFPPDLRAAAKPALMANAEAGTSPLRIGILVYDGFFTLDAIGPLALLAQLDGVDVSLIRRGDEPVVRSGRSRFQVATSIADVAALDVLIVPGGADGTWALGQDAEALDWIRRIDAHSRITAGVCTGSWVLGEAGLLRGRRATSNWYRASDMMARYGATFVGERYVRDGKLWTSAGVSAGLDLSVALARELRGEAAAAQMVARTAYWPQPPIRAGSPATTDERVLDMMHRMYDAMMMPLIGERDD